jgi:crotonobetainyl-CoA:carnitine CoA-transferase CaiB-like acyl-CoA transferase
MTGALDGVRVLDASTGTAGPMAGMLLGDYGADVVKVEARGGDPARARPGFAMWNRNKRGCAGNGTDLVASADVLITSGVSAPTPASPSLVHLHLPPYLDEAPWAGQQESAALLGALTGLARRQASFDDVPVDSIYPHVLYAQGIWGAACAVAALVEREASGRGQRVTVGGVHGVMVTSPGMFAFDPDQEPVRRGAGGGGGSVPFYKTYQCADGEWLFLAALTPNFYLPAFDALGVADMIDDERVGGRPGGLLKPENIPWVIERMAAVFRTRPRADWLELFDGLGIPAGPVLERDDWLDHPQIAAIGMRVEVDDPERGRVTMPGLSITMTRTPGSVRHPAPAREDPTLEWFWGGLAAPNQTK